MSQQRSGIPQPRGSNLPRPEQVQPPKPDEKKAEKSKKGDKKTIEFQLPALSIVGKKKGLSLSLKKTSCIIIVYYRNQFWWD